MSVCLLNHLVEGASVDFDPFLQDSGPTLCHVTV